MSTPTFTPVDGGVCAVPGITASGISAGLKASGKPDLAVVAAPAPVPVAGVQTTNRVPAAPVRVSREHLAGGAARAILLNSGSANACTGPDGVDLARESAAVAARELGCAPTEVLLASTGVIGVPIRREPFLDGIPHAVAALADDGGSDAATAIMTTDTRRKEAAIFATDGSGSCTVGGMVKGSGMIAPSMSTMLCVITTDAPVSAPVLKASLRGAVNRTFNRISVDECMSTNDAVFALATGAAGRPPGLEAFNEALTRVCDALAEAVVRDGEGASTVVHVRVTGARSEGDAVAVARQVAASNLVKTAVAGNDPNWGRVLGAVGAAGVELDPDGVSVAFGGVTVCRDGALAPFDRALAVQQLAGDDVWISVDLGTGPAEATVRTCDLTHQYITINAEYTT